MTAYIVGIDLGTTHTVVAFAPAAGRVTATSIRLFEIEHDTALAAMQSEPKVVTRYGLAAPGRITGRWLDLDDLRAELAEDKARVGAREEGRQVEYPHIGQRRGEVGRGHRERTIRPGSAPVATPSRYVISPLTTVAR